MSKQQQWMRNRPDGPLHKADISCESNGCWPVAVIDPEDREQVDLLCKTLVEKMYAAGDERSAANGVHPATVAAALREFADPKPPKPEEPLAPAAVVVDSDGVPWVSWRQVGLTTHNRPWQSLIFDQEEDDFRNYEDIDVVRVVSEGVQAGDPR